MNQPDVAVHSPDGKLQLIVEVKARRDTSPEWATRLRRNLLVHSLVPPAPFFLLAFPDRFYLWNDSSSANPEAPPDYVLDAA